MASPPPPPGFVPEPKAKTSKGSDVFGSLLSVGVEATNGYRTPADLERIRAQGYKPAANSLHLKGDAIDLTPGRSGLSMKEVERRARAAASAWPGAKVINEGHHVHAQLPGWGMAPGTPGTPNSGLPKAPAGFQLQQRGSLTGDNFVRDGDTFKLPDGRNARIQGMDAYELNQQGRRTDGTLVPLGQNARNSLAARMDAGTSVSFTGKETYGRPVVTLGQGGVDPALGVVREGNALAAPEYLKNSPNLLAYMEAERLARQNRLGGHGTNAETPKQFRDKSGPWAGAEPGKFGDGGTAIFADERTPFQGLRNEIEQGYLQLAMQPGTSADDLLGYAETNGFQIRKEDAERFVKLRDQGANITAKVFYEDAPKPITNPGDGAFGSFARGFGDPVNMIDELGGVADAVGLTGGRENVFNSERRFGDILWNNIDQNRAILAHDDEAHPIARIGGQLTSGVLLPIAGSARTVGALTRVGAVEGGLAGFGAGEGGLIDRAPNAAGGAILGAAGGYALGRVADDFGRGLNLRRLGSPSAARLEAGFEAAPIVNSGAQNIGPTPAARSQPAGGALNAANDIHLPGTRNLGGDVPREFQQRPYFADEAGNPRAGTPDEIETSLAQSGIRYDDPWYRDPEAYAAEADAWSRLQDPADGPASAAMRSEDLSPELIGPDLGDVPPPPSGFVPDAPFGVMRPMDERLDAAEIARLAEDVDPQSVLPRPANRVETLEEAEKAAAGRFPLVKAEDERSYLESREVRSGAGGSVKMRGPLDTTQRLRTYGGLKDSGGDLRFVGATNAGRRGMDFGGNEQFLGRLVNNETGISFDEAAIRLTEDGYFHEVPDTDELLSRLYAEADGSERFFAPDDLNEVANFEGARAQREAIESAAANGSPYVDDLSHEITLDDLDAMQAPLSAYEDGPRLTGKVGNINLDRLENPGDVSQLIEQVSKRVGGFDPAKRGKITHDETERLAVEMGLKPEQLMKRVQGQALNAEQLYATRVLAQKSRELVGRLAQKAVNTGADEDVLAFRKAWVRHVAIEEQVAGATAEAGRALQQFRMLAKAGNARSDAVKAYLKGAGGKDSIEDAARAIVDLIEDPAKASHFMREGLKPGWMDKFNELWVNSLLSGPKTHVVNFVGNAMTMLYTLPEQALTAGIGALTRSADRSTAGEIGARISGLANSAVEGLKNARVAFRTGEAVDGTSKIDAVQQKAISGPKGEVIRLPTRALTAADEFWKTINRNAEMHALAYRRAVQDAASPADRKALYEKLLANPDEGMAKAADQAARYYTFQKDLGEYGQAIQRLSNKVPGGKILMPFVRTPINLLKFAGERSIFAPLSKNIRAELAKGGRARDEALAKITLGSGLSTAAVIAAMDGKVTGGGPADRGERMALLQSGWQPYSIRVGDEWVSYQRFDPLSLLFGAAADFAELGRFARPQEADQFALALTQAVAKNITNKTWLSGLSDAFDVMSDPQRYGEGYVQRMAGSMLVPAIASQAAQSTDPYMREARSILDAIKARVPVVSQGLPVRRNVWGEEVKRGDAVGPDILSPIYGTKIDNSPVAQEIARLRVPLSMPKRQITVGGEKIDLDAEQYDILTQLAGKPARTYLEGYIATPEYQALSDLDRIEAVREIMKDFRKSGVDALKGMYPELGGGLAPRDVPPPPAAFLKKPAPKLKPKSLRDVVPERFVNPTPPPPSGFIPEANAR